jgi:hypothetical protein
MEKSVTRAEAVTAMLYVIGRQYIGEGGDDADVIKFVTAVSEYCYLYFDPVRGKAN